MMRRFDRLPRPLAAKLVVAGFAVAALAFIVLAAFAAVRLIDGAAPGHDERLGLACVIIMVVLRFAPSKLERPAGKRTVDICASIVLGVCVLWYIRTGSPSPFGVSAIFWYLAGLLIGRAIDYCSRYVRSLRARHDAYN